MDEFNQAVAVVTDVVKTLPASEKTAATDPAREQTLASPDAKPNANTEPREGSGTVVETRTFAVSAREVRWQRQLLPFMMAVLSLLSVFFIAMNIYQVDMMQKKIVEAPKIDLTQAVPVGRSDAGQLDFIRWKTLSSLEAYALENRYHQANALLLTRVWTKNLGIVTGMLLSIIGATFILGKLRDPGSDVGGEGAGWKMSLKTASPGVVVVVLGTVLMIVTMFLQPRIDVDDNPVYMGIWQPGTVSVRAGAVGEKTGKAAGNSDKTKENASEQTKADPLDPAAIFTKSDKQEGSSVKGDKP